MTRLIRIRTECEQPAVTVLHDESARLPGSVSKAARELDTTGQKLGVERVRVLNEQVCVEEFVGVFVRTRDRRFRATEVDSVLVARHDRVHRWVPPST